MEIKEPEIVSLIQDSDLDEIYKAQLLYANMKSLHSLKAVGVSEYEAEATKMIADLKKLPSSRNSSPSIASRDERQRIINMLNPEIDRFVETRVKHNVESLKTAFRDEIPNKGWKGFFASICHSMLGSLAFLLLLTFLTHAGFLGLFFEILKKQVLSPSGDISQ